MTTLYFEDLEPGLTFTTGLSGTITAAMVEVYFALTGDRFNIHRDVKFAQMCGLPAAMVPGNLVVALATGLVYEAGYFSESLVVQARKYTTFVHPIYVGERIYVRESITSIEDRAHKNYGRVVLDRTVMSDSHVVIQRVDQDYRVLKHSLLLDAQHIMQS